MIGPDIVKDTEAKVQVIWKRLKVASDRQKSYASDASHKLPVQEVQVHVDFSYDEEPKAILAREVKQLRNKQVELVKVL